MQDHPKRRLLSNKWKRVLYDMIIIVLISVFSAIVVNNLRSDGIPLFPPYMHGNFYHKMSFDVFQKDMLKNHNRFIFDARPHEIYEKNHLSGALNFPVSGFDFFYDLYLANISRDVPIFIYGRTLSFAYDLELAYGLYLRGHKDIIVIL